MKSVAASRPACARSGHLWREPPSRRPRPAGADTTGQPRPSSRPQPPSSAAGINFVRVDVIVTDKNGNERRRPQGKRLRGHRRREAADGRKLQAHQARRRPDAGRRPAAADSHRRRRRRPKPRATTCGCSSSSSTTITCDGWPAWAFATRSTKFIETQLGPSDMIGLMYPLAVGAERPDDAQSRRHRAGDSKVSWAQVRLHPENDIRGAVRELPDRDRRADPQRGVAVGAQGLIIHMGALKQGRKSLILVSEGFTYMLPPQMRSPNSQMPAIAGSQPGGGGTIQSPRSRAQFFARRSTCSRICATLRRGQPQQRVDLRGRSARSGGVRVRHERAVVGNEHGSAVPERHDGHAADAGRKHRRPRHREPQRSRGRDEADHPRQQRLLPARLQLDRRRRPTASSTRSRSA